MIPNVLLGVFLHSVGGYAAASFYIPFKKVKNWAWETYWLVGGFFSWIIAPSVVAYLAVPELGSILREAPESSFYWSYFFGVLWGIGGLTFGLSMRYLGMSLGYAIVLGFCAFFGTIIPPIFTGEIGGIVATTSGLVTLGGLAVCLLGIAVCAHAGVLKERELSREEQKKSIQEFNFRLGVWVALLSGVMSACMAFAIAAGKPIAALAVQYNTPQLWQNSPLFIIILAGGFTTNFIWSVILNIRNRTGGEYFRSSHHSFLSNYFFSAVAGITWYFQFMFYGMGTTQMGSYDFSSWTLHMAFIIIFSNVWALLFREWRGVHRRTLLWIISGILVLILSTCIVGVGNYLASLGM